jgi:hypothetical protein
VAAQLCRGRQDLCVYIAENQAAIRKHSELSGIPGGAITEIAQAIDPLTANN